MPPPGALCIIQFLNYRPRVVVQRDNANNRDLVGQAIESITYSIGMGKSKPQGPTFQWEMRL